MLKLWQGFEEFNCCFNCNEKQENYVQGDENDNFSRGQLPVAGA